MKTILNKMKTLNLKEELKPSNLLKNKYFWVFVGIKTVIKIGLIVFIMKLF